MLDVGKQQNGVTLDRWLLRGPSRRDVLLTSTTHENAKAAVVEAKRSHRYDNSKCSYVASRDTSSGTAPKASRVRRGKVHDQSHGQFPTQQQQSTNGPAQHTRSKTTRMASSSATP